VNLAQFSTVVKARKVKHLSHYGKMAIINSQTIVKKKISQVVWKSVTFILWDSGQERR